MDWRHRRFGLSLRLGWAVVDVLPLSSYSGELGQALFLGWRLAVWVPHKTHPHMSVAASSLGTRTRVLVLRPWFSYQSRFLRSSSPLLSLSLSLTVEHLKVLKVEHLKVLMVEHLKVLSSPYQSSPLKGRSHSLFIWWGSLTVEHACASLTVEHLKVLISRAPCRVLALGSARPPDLHCLLI